MYISKINIFNFKCFNGKFTLVFKDGTNIIVGNNEAGKSTILEAINLALSCLYNGCFIKNEISQYLFNNDVVSEFLQQVEQRQACELPSVLIEVFFQDSPDDNLKGTNNSDREDANGVFLKIEFDETYRNEYNEMITQPCEIKTLPVEYYKITWSSFSRDSITTRSIPMKTAFIDPSSYHSHKGSDIYISRIIQNMLSNSQKAGLCQAYRKSNEVFMQDTHVSEINNQINNGERISQKSVHISANLASATQWETSLMTYVEDVPFQNIGKGEQCVIKTNLALSQPRNRAASLLLLEEPESHLSHSKLNEFTRSVVNQSSGKQIIITTHSSFVSNKLGLENLIFLHDKQSSRLSDLHESTQKYFKKLPGYDTLRLMLCNKPILVEGPTDELIVQRAYMDRHEGKLPIEDGIDVISVKGLSFLRFLEIADKLDKPVAVVTDNDRDFDQKITHKYRDYSTSQVVEIFADSRNSLNTLEPQFADANRNDLDTLRSVLQINSKDYPTFDDIVKYMIGNKTEWALKVMESEQSLQYPDYINRLIDWCDEE